MTKKGLPGAFIEQALQFTGDACLIWPYAITSVGYGFINGRLVSRVICERVNGPPPFPRADAAHTCGIRACVNPRHLRWATRKSNLADMIAHGTTTRGEKNGRAILRPVDVLAIRASTLPSYKLAKVFNVSPSHIRNVRNRGSWKHI